MKLQEILRIETEKREAEALQFNKERQLLKTQTEEALARAASHQAQIVRDLVQTHTRQAEHHETTLKELQKRHKVLTTEMDKHL